MRFSILLLCLVQFGVQASDNWLNRTIRVDLNVDRNHEPFDPRLVITGPDNTLSDVSTFATNGQYPWSVFSIAWIFSEWGWSGQTCSNTIISKNFGLSDFYCVNQNSDRTADRIDLYLGRARLPLPSPSLPSPTNFIRHYWYIEPSSENRPNIVLFRLHETLTFNPNVQPIRLPFDKNFSYEGWSSVTLGYTSFAPEPAWFWLLSMPINITAITESSLCENAIGVIAEYEICSRDPIENDFIRFTSFAGGPLIVSEYNHAGLQFTPVLIGIQDFNADRRTAFRRATRVSHFLDWIEILSNENS